MNLRLNTLLAATALGLLACGKVTEDDGGPGEAGSGGRTLDGSGGEETSSGGEQSGGSPGAGGSGADSGVCAELTDPGLATALWEAAGVPLNEKLTDEDVANVYSLSAEAVSSLAGLPCLPDLAELIISNSPDLVSLSLLAQTPQLVRIELLGVMASDYSVLTELPELQVLAVEDSPLTDLTPLVASERLGILTVSGVAISDLSPLTTALSRGMISVSVTRAEVTDLSPLLDAPTPPERFHIQENPLSDAAMQEQIPQLVEQGWCVVTGSLLTGDEHPPGCVVTDRP